MFVQLIEAVRVAAKPSEKKTTKLQRLFNRQDDPFFHGSRKAARGDAAVAKDRKHPLRKHYDDVVRDARQSGK